MINLTKDDFISFFPKERMAELLIELMENEEILKQEISELRAKLAEQQIHVPYPYEPQPYITWQDKNTTGNPPCFSKDGVCTNPFHDCVNCPRQFGGWGDGYKTNTATRGTSHLTVNQNNPTEAFSTATSKDFNSEFVQYTSEARQD